MKLLPNEKNLATLNDGAVVLTNIRISLEKKVSGEFVSIHIFLEDISSVEIKYTTKPFLLALAVILPVLLLLFNNMSGTLVLAFFLGVGFFIAWLVTEARIISITSDGSTSLNFEANLNDERDFIDSVLFAKHSRINQIYKLD